MNQIRMTLCNRRLGQGSAKLSSLRGSGNQFIEETVQTRQLKFLHKFGIALRPGGTPEISRWRNHRMRPATSTQPRRGDRPASVRRPSGAGNISLLASGGYATLHHRLISAAPPAQKTCVETSARQFALPWPSRSLTPIRASFLNTRRQKSFECNLDRFAIACTVGADLCVCPGVDV